MRRRLVLFGIGQIAELAHFYFTNDTNYVVDGFTVDDAYATVPELLGLPVVPFSQVTWRFPPATHDAFVAVGYAQMNRLRTERFSDIEAMGYTLATYVSSRATVWMPDRIGRNCLVLEENTVQPYVTIGDNCFVWSGNHLGHHSTIMDGTFIASHVVISGDVTVGRRCFLGVNSTVRNGITIGDECIVGAGAVIMHDAAPGGVYPGHEAARIGVPSSRVRL